MKKLIIPSLILCTLILLWCFIYRSSRFPVLKIIDPQENFYEYDFRKYDNLGFLFLTDKYYGEYTLLGTISLEEYPMGEYRSLDIKNPIKYSWEFEEIFLPDVIEKIYQKSIEFGGDAFVNFTATRITTEVDTNKKGYPIANPTSLTGIKISGDIIKRKN